MKSLSVLVFAFILSGCLAGRYLVYPPEIYGSLQELGGEKPNVILSPFLAIEVKNGKVRESSADYPVQPISFWIFRRIQEKTKILFPDSAEAFFHLEDTTNPRYKMMESMVTQLAHAIVSEPDSVQLWKGTNVASQLDSSTFFYIPILVENENGGDYQPSFFTLIANNKGEILYSVKIRGYFKPGMWAKDYRNFASDTRNVMPFAKSGF